MNVDTLLKDTFAAREDLAGDPDAVLAAVRERIAHRPSPLGRPIAIAAGVVAIAGVASGAVALSHHDTRSGTASMHQAAGPGHAAPIPAAGSTALTMPYDLGWLPEGSAAYHVRRLNDAEPGQSGRPVFDGEYILTVTASTGTTDIDVQQAPGDLAGARFKSGPGRPVTIDHRSGIEITNPDGSYELYFDDAAGGLMYLDVRSESGGGAAENVATGRRVAANVRFPGTAQVQPSFGIGYFPPGTKVRAFDVESGLTLGGTVINGPVTQYEIWTRTTLQATVSTASAAGPGTPGRAVQGHPTRYTDENGYRTLFVLGAVDGKPVQLSGRLPLAELYTIADGLILPR